ncbi:MAG: hypothetical protein AAF412_14895, partial [Pseudomonadota bacterium]
MLGTLCVVILSATLIGVARRVRGAVVRFLAGIIACFALFNPSFLQEDRTSLPTIIPLVIDETTSQKLADRGSATAEAVANLKSQFERLDKFELREIRTTDRISESNDVSSALFGALSIGLQDTPPERVGSAIMITDGQVHDAPQSRDANGFSPPIHVLLTGKENEKDRRISLKNAPRYGVVG